MDVEHLGSMRTAVEAMGALRPVLVLCVLTAFALTGCSILSFFGQRGMALFGETGAKHFCGIGLAVCEGERNVALILSLLTTAFIPGCCTDLASAKGRGGVWTTGTSGDRAGIPGGVGSIIGASGIGGVKTAGLSGGQDTVFASFASSTM